MTNIKTSGSEEPPEAAATAGMVLGHRGSSNYAAACRCWAFLGFARDHFVFLTLAIIA